MIKQKRMIRSSVRNDRNE